MLRKISFVAVAAVGMWIGQGTTVEAQTCHNHSHGYSSAYRPPVAYYGYGVPNYNAYQIPYNVGRPIYSGGYSGLSYYGSNYGSGFNAPFGGYGMGGFPRNGSYGGGGGFSLNIGR